MEKDELYNTKERIEMFFKFMEYDNLSEAQENIIISLEEYFLKHKKLSDKQFDLLSDIFKYAEDK